MVSSLGGPLGNKPPTYLLSGVDSLVLARYCFPCVVLIGVLDEGEALVHGDTNDASVTLKHRLHSVLRQGEGVQVADEEPRVDGQRVRRVRHVADLAHVRCGGGGGGERQATSGGRVATAGGARANQKHLV